MPGPVFLGESSSLTLVHSQLCLGGKKRLVHKKPGLRYSLPPGDSSGPRLASLEGQYRARKYDYLVQAGAFTFPESGLCQVLLETYFRRFHSFFPVLDKQTFRKAYLSNSISPLLMQSVLFIGASLCEVNAFPGGSEAKEDMRFLSFKRAKDLYDSEDEADKVVVVQALFMMSFFRAGPLLEKGSRHYLAAGINLAQNKGFHRRSETVINGEQRLKKRIWWCLYIRDRQCCAAVGLPNRVRDEDCDVEDLVLTDFEEDLLLPSCFGSNFLPEHAHCVIEMARLAKLLGRIVALEFAPVSLHESNRHRTNLVSKHEEWQANLPPGLRLIQGSQPSLHVSTLHVSYWNLHMLLHRSEYAKQLDSENGHVALEAACRITRILEDLLSHHPVHYGIPHLTSCFFNTLCIHTINLRWTHGAARKVAESRARICLLGLKELRKTWDVDNWILRLYFQHIELRIARSLRPVHEEEASDPEPGESPPANATSRPQPPAGGGDKPDANFIFRSTPPMLDHMVASLAPFPGQSGLQLQSGLQESRSASQHLEPDPFTFASFTSDFDDWTLGGFFLQDEQDVDSLFSGMNN